MPLPIQNARISKLIHDAYNIVGRYRARIDETVVPVAIVDNFAEGGGFPEVRRASATFRQAGVAGQVTVARFETPPNILGVIRQITLNVGGTGLVRAFFGSSIAAPANTAAKAFIDGRVRNRGEIPGGVLTFGTQVGALVATHWTCEVINTNGRIVDNLLWPIGQVAAFDFMELEVNGNNVALDVAIVWDEYLIRP